jgi:hypothetical protein
MKKLLKFLNNLIGILMQIMLAPFVAIMVAALFSNTIINSEVTHSHIEKYINRKIKDYVDFDIAFKGLNINLMALSLEVNQLSITASDTKEVLLNLSQGTTGISIFNLALAKVKLSNLNIEKLFVNIEGLIDRIRVESSNSNEKFKWPPDFPLPIESVSITNFSTKIDSYYQDDDAEIKISDAVLTLKLESWKNISLKIDQASLNYITETVALIPRIAISGEAVWDGESVTLTKMQAQNHELNLSAQANARILTKDQIEFPVKIQAKANAKGNLSVLGSFLDFQNTSGVSSLNLEAKVLIPEKPDDATFQIDIKGKVEDGWLYGYSLLDSKLDLEINQDRIWFRDVEIIENGKSYGHINGNLSFNSAISYSFNLKPNSLKLSQILEIVGTKFNAFDFDLTSEKLALFGTGSPFAMTLKGPSNLKDLRFPDLSPNKKNLDGPPTCDVGIDLKIDTNKLKILNNSGECQHGSTIVFNGPIYFSDRGIDLSVAFQSPKINPLSYWAHIPLQGEGLIQTKIVGPWSGIEVKNKVSLRNAMLGEIPLFNLSANVDYDVNHNMISWENVNSNDKFSNLKMNRGHLKLDDYAFTTDIEAENLSEKFIPGLLKVLNASINLQITVKSLKGTVSGDLLKPGEWKGNGKFNLTKILFENQILADDCKGEFDFKAKDQQVKVKVCTKNNLQISGTASLAKQANKPNSPLQTLGYYGDDLIHLDITTLNLPAKNGDPKIKQLKSIPFIETTMEKLQLDSDLDGKFYLRGTLDHPIGVAEIQLRNISFRGSTLPRVIAKVELNGGKFDIKASMGGKNTDVRFTVEPFLPKLPYTLKVIASQSDLRSLFPSNFYNDPRNFVLISGFINLEGNLTEFYDSKGSLNLKHLKVSYTDQTGKALRINSHQDETIVLKNRSLAISGNRTLKIESNGVDVYLEPNLGQLPNALDLKFSGNFNLVLTKMLSTAIETASGRIKFQGSVYGDISSPKYIINIEDEASAPVVLGISGLRPTFSDLNFKAIVSSDMITIEKFIAKKGTGIVKAEGNYGFGEQQDKGITVELKEASLIRTIPYLKDFDALISGKLLFKRGAQSIGITGDLEIVRARLNREFDVRTEIISALRNAKFEVSQERTKESAVLDIRVHSDSGISVSNRNMDLILACDLKVSGTDLDPKVLGLVEIKQGKFVFRSDYKISRGLISFDPSHGADPSLDILGNADIDNHRVDVQVTGRGSSPLINISVDPPTKSDGSIVSETDALMLVTTGSLPTNGQGLAESNLKSGGLNIIAGQFERPVERLFDLTGQKIVKSVYLDSYPSHTNGSPLFRANASLQIADNLDFIIQADQEQRGFSAEYPIDPNVNASLNYSKSTNTKNLQNGEAEYDAGFDLRFRFSFP